MLLKHPHGPLSRYRYVLPVRCWSRHKWCYPGRDNEWHIALLLRNLRNPKRCYNHDQELPSYVRKLVTELSGGVFGYLDSVLERHSFDEFGELI